MSRFHNRNFELLEPYDAKVSCTVLRGESIRKDADLLDKKYFDALRSVNNLVRDARKVQQCVLMVGEMSDIYVNNFRKMLADSNFSAEELTAIASGYTLLLSEGSYLLDELKQLTSVTTLRMNDYERMQMIDKVYRDITRYRNLLHYYTRKTISVSYLRGKAAGDSARVAALYGSQQERYY